jgi:hypothetical protein
MKLHASETSSFTYYKIFKIEPTGKGGEEATVFWDCEGILLCDFLAPKNNQHSQIL